MSLEFDGSWIESKFKEKLMPHLIVEYSANIADLVRNKGIVKIAHNAMMNSGLFSLVDIKTRSYRSEDFLVGDMGTNGGFIHITVYLLAGRTVGQKQTLSRAILESVSSSFADIIQISVDIRDIVKETYSKLGTKAS